MRPFSIPPLIFIAVLTQLACGESSGEPTTSSASIDIELDANQVAVTHEQFTTAGFELGRVVDTAFSAPIKVYGYVDVPPKSKAMVSVYYGGYVESLDLLPGQWVKKGQLLFSLTNPDFIQMQQDYLETQAQIAFLKSDFERLQTLAAENIASQKDFLKAKSDYEVQMARLEGLRQKLQMLGIDLQRVEARELVTKVSVYAPISGSVTAVHASTGSFLQPADAALEITNTDHLHLELDVFEKDLQHIRRGQAISFRVPGAGARTYPATVHLVGKQVEGESRVVRVHGHLDESAELPNLLPGMYVEASIEGGTYPVRALPEAAVITLDDQAYVLVQQNQSTEGYVFDRRMVETGHMSNGLIEIVGTEPSAGQPVLIKGAFNLIREE